MLHDGTTEVVDEEELLRDVLATDDIDLDLDFTKQQQTQGEGGGEEEE